MSPPTLIAVAFLTAPATPGEVGADRPFVNGDMATTSAPTRSSQRPEASGPARAGSTAAVHESRSLQGIADLGYIAAARSAPTRDFTP